jgi:ubiquinone/menaquinone biosynthesis C-methylase UbiE
MANDQTPKDIHSVVREHYGQIASGFQADKSASCGCKADKPASASCCDSQTVSSQLKIYETADVATLPEDVTGLSLGCGDPVTLAALQPGQTVLDLGSGGGIDCFLSAQKVGPTGKVIGVDMTAEMLEKARQNRAKLGLDNVEFRLGEIEHLPVADNTIDVIISNCVINLSPDKPQVFREAFRVLHPGGKLSVSDITTNGPLPEVVKSNLSAWAGCVGGALDVKDYVAAIEAAGFVDVNIARVYFSKEMAKEMAGEAINLDEFPNINLSQAVFSAKITARKPE